MVKGFKFELSENVGGGGGFCTKPKDTKCSQIVKTMYLSVYILILEIAININLKLPDNAKGDTFYQNFEFSISFSLALVLQNIIPIVSVEDYAISRSPPKSLKSYKSGLEKGMRFRTLFICLIWTEDIILKVPYLNRRYNSQSHIKKYDNWF